MAESRWYISVDGQQVENDHSLEAARELVHKNLGKRVLVWSQGMTQWTMPEELPEFRMSIPKPAPMPQVEPPGEEKDILKAYKTAVETDEIRKQAGFLKGLLDFRFQELITGKIVPILYGIAIVLVAIAALGYFLIGGGGMILAGIKTRTMFSVFTGLLIMVLTPILAVVYLALIRIWFEFLIVVFRIKDDLTTLVERKKEDDIEP